MKCLSYNHFFEVFANQTRLKIIESLIESPKCVSDLCDEIKEEQSKISHNLKILTGCNFIKVEQDGKKRVYSINSDTIKPLMELANRHVTTLCGGKCCKEK